MEELDLTTLRLEIGQAGVARLGLARPDSANAINLEMAAELRRVAVHLAHRDDVRAVLIGSTGPVFCGGGDLAEFEAANRAEMPAHIEHLTIDLHAGVARLARLNAPIIAAVTGSVGGAGMSLVAACDLVVCGESVKFTMGYTRVGLVPDGTSSFFLSRVVGMRRAIELVLTNRVLTADEARDWGLVTAVVPDDQVEERANTWAEQMAAGPTATLGWAKHVVYEGAHSSLEEAMERESRAISMAAHSDDAREGISAFVHKRAPHFNGRA